MFGFPPPQPARRASSSGRAVHDDEDRNASGPVDQVVDEVEEPVVRPVEILEDEDERALFGEPSKNRRQAANASGRLISVQLLLALDSDERAEVTLDPLGFGVVNQLTHAVSQLALRSRRGESVSRIPAWALTISPSAQNETPSPYGSERPWRQ